MFKDYYKDKGIMPKSFKILQNSEDFVLNRPSTTEANKKGKGQNLYLIKTYIVWIYTYKRFICHIYYSFVGNRGLAMAIFLNMELKNIFHNK